MLIELSYIISLDMPKWPTNPAERIEYNTVIQNGDPSNASSVFHHLHTGTHVDAPFHFDANGKTIDQIPIEDFHYTKPLVLEIAKGKGERIRYEDLKLHESEIKECDILFLYTGHSRLRDISPENFVDNFPCMEVMAAKYLRKEFPELKAIAMDSISYDSAITGGDEGFPCHHALLETNSEQKERTLLLFEDVNIKFTEGNCYGLIGANGAGKSTFLKILTGQIEPSKGDVSITPGQRLSFLEQDHFKYDEYTVLDTVIMGNTRLYEIMKEKEAIYAKEDFTEEDGNKASELEAEFADMNGWEAESDAAQLLNGLGITTDLHYKLMSELNGSEKVKVLLAQALFGNPDILLLDEPTNYLDEEHIAWLKRYLLDYENAFILISHDIPFLNEVVNIIYHMENQELNRYVGDYDHFQEVYAVKKAQLEAAYRRQQQEISELKDFVARNKARVSTRNMAMSRQKKLDKMDVIELAAERPKPEFHFKYGRTPGKMLFETKDLVTGYDEALSKPLNFSMERGQKIALVGTNGIGKTTLLKSILGLIPSLSGSVELGDNLELGYFEQEVKGENRNSCIEELWQEFPSYTQYQVRSALAKCGLTTKHIESQVRVLSGGEQAKVRLCKLLNRDTNFLLLDEPTNHLDVDAKDSLKQALQEYKGSILLICHEPEFYQDVVDEVWDMSQWTTKVF